MTFIVTATVEVRVHATSIGDAVKFAAQRLVEVSLLAPGFGVGADTKLETPVVRDIAARHEGI